MSTIRARWAAIGAAIAVTLGAGGGFGLAQATQSSGERPVFVSIVPCRVSDTRPDQGVGGRISPIGAGEALVVSTRPAEGPCAGQVPSDATAVGLNITAVQATASTFLTVYPGDADNPGTSTLNPDPTAARTVNGATTGIDASGTFNVFNNAGSVHAIIDINGYYVDHNHDDRYYTETETDAAIAATVDSAISGALEVVQTPGVGLADVDFVPDIAAVRETVTTEQEGRWLVTKQATLLTDCSGSNVYYYLLIDGDPVRSSVNATTGDWTAVTLTGTTDTAIPAGDHRLEIGAECSINTPSGVSFLVTGGSSLIVLPS